MEAPVMTTTFPETVGLLEFMFWFRFPSRYLRPVVSRRSAVFSQSDVHLLTTDDRRVTTAPAYNQ